MVKSNDVARTDRQLAVIVGALVMGLYLRNVAQDLLAGDSGEFHFAAWQWGLAHPTGYPFYLLIGGLWQHLWALVGLSPAAALNALSAVAAGAAAGLFFWLMATWLPGRPLVRWLAAGLAVAMLAANPTVRSQGVLAEVYALHLLLIVAILAAARQVAAAKTPQRPAGPLVLLALLVGLALTHHATTVLLLPPILIYLFLADRAWWRRSPGAWVLAVLAGAAPLLLYLYIPLRSGPGASPWYHQPLGSGVLTLYDGSWRAFTNYITGQSISIGFRPPAAALAQLPAALLLWLRHFEWLGLLLAGIGIFVLVRMRAWALLALTLSYFVLQQVFDLFYAIGDIFVYYLPLYLVGCLWVGFGAAGIALALRVRPAELAVDSAAGSAAPRAQLQRWLTALVVLFFFLPAQLWTRYSPLVEQINTESSRVRAAWNEILAADPAPGAILVSNDRDEIVPLFYLQYVEQKLPGRTGLFPLIAPEARFADIGATLETALAAAGGRPVYLIKSMPGLDARFDLAPRTAPLVEVLGPAGRRPPQTTVNQAYGPLTLLGYDWKPTAGGAEVALHWRVDQVLPADYTATVQLFDSQGQKVGQDDHRPGGEYYPSSHWKAGDVIMDRHSIQWSGPSAPVRLLLGLYRGPDAQLLAPALNVSLPAR